jgi:carbonic anhydrase/acetyltransferase-like protein (isoleucine patch superfamily)
MDNFPRFSDARERLEYYLKLSPTIDPSVRLAPGVVLIGDVRLGAEVSVWSGAILRADLAPIVIGPRTNLQEGVIVHLADDLPVIVGERVTVGHAAILHACTVEDHCLIGMRATVMDKAVIGKGSLIGAHSLVTEGTIIPPGSLVMGSPARVVRALTKEEQAKLPLWADKYVLSSQLRWPTAASARAI